MNKIDPLPPAELLIKYLAGEATPEEALLVDEWISRPAGKKEYEAFVGIWNLGGEDKVPLFVDPSGEWERIQVRISSRKKGPAVLKPLLRYTTVAAALLGLILTAYFLFNKKSSVDDLPAKLQATQVVETAKDSLREITLRDGSHIAMARNSELRYATSFNEKEREVVLSGEAYFDVSHNPTRPFIIRAGAVRIQVIGTSFNIRTAAEGRSVEVQVKSGVVKMSADSGEMVVKPQQTGVYFTGSRKFILKPGIDLNAIGYATRSFQFHDQSIGEVCRYLEKSFDVRIDFDRVRFGDCRITAQFDDKPLTYILDVITATLDATHRQVNEQVSIEGKGCQ